MNQLEVIIISGRTAEQGAGLEIGKTSEHYFKSVAALELSITDADELGLEDGDPVNVFTPHGSVVVITRRTDGLDPGLAFFPYGPWANQIFGSYTGGTGMPSLRGVKATVRRAKDEAIPTLDGLVDALRGER